MMRCILRLVLLAFVFHYCQSRYLLLETEGEGGVGGGEHEMVARSWRRKDLEVEEGTKYPQDEYTDEPEPSWTDDWPDGYPVEPEPHDQHDRLRRKSGFVDFAVSEEKKESGRRLFSRRQKFGGNNYPSNAYHDLDCWPDDCVWDIEEGEFRDP